MYAGYKKNVERSLAKGRVVEVYFVYRPPELAWDFTKKREAIEHRRISREAFIHGFLLAREHANRVKVEFQERVKLTILVRDGDAARGYIKENITNIDDFIQTQYTREQLETLLL